MAVPNQYAYPSCKYSHFDQWTNQKESCILIDVYVFVVFLFGAVIFGCTFYKLLQLLVIV